MSGPCEQAESTPQAMVVPNGSHEIFFTQPIYSSSYPCLLLALFQSYFVETAVETSAHSDYALPSPIPSNTN